MLLTLELDILGTRSAYHYLLEDEDQALHWATLYIKWVSLSPPRSLNPRSLCHGLWLTIHLSLFLCVSVCLWCVSVCVVVVILSFSPHVGAGACRRIKAVSSDSHVVLQDGRRSAGPHWQMEAFGTDVGGHARMDLVSPDRAAARSTLSDASAPTRWCSHIWRP